LRPRRAPHRLDGARWPGRPGRWLPAAGTAQSPRLAA
jgi:hypothetical protein